VWQFCGRGGKLARAILAQKFPVHQPENKFPQTQFPHHIIMRMMMMLFCLLSQFQ
jgi:hypothetical protein